MIWPDFCSAFIVRRLVPLDLHNTRFPPLPVSRSPMTGAAASSSATRPTGTSPVPDRPGRGTFCISIPARSCTRRRRIRPWRCHGSVSGSPRRPGGHRRPSTPDALDSQLAHGPYHLVAADLTGIPALRDQPGVGLPMPMHSHEEIRVDLENVARQRLAARLHGAHGPVPEHAVASRREEPAIQRLGKDPADRPNPETTFMFVDVRGLQCRVGSSLAAKKAGAAPGPSPPRLSRSSPTNTGNAIPSAV